MTDVGPSVRRLLDAYGLTERIGRANLHESIEDLIAAAGDAGEARSRA